MVRERHLRNNTHANPDTHTNANANANADSDTNSYANADTDRTDQRRESRPDQTRVHRLLPFLER